MRCLPCLPGVGRPSDARESGRDVVEADVGGHGV